MKYYVYQLTRAEAAQPFYIGLTRDPKTRALNHKGKHGTSTQFEVLHEFATEEEAIAKETELIKWHSEHGNIVNLRGVKGTRQARKGMHARLTAERAERKRTREASRAAEAKERRTRHEAAISERQRKAKVAADTKSGGTVVAAFVVLRGLLTGLPTDRETALHALEVIRLAPGAMELARVYIKANII